MNPRSSPRFDGRNRGVKCPTAAWDIPAAVFTVFRSRFSEAWNGKGKLIMPNASQIIQSIEMKQEILIQLGHALLSACIILIIAYLALKVIQRGLSALSARNFINPLVMGVLRQALRWLVFAGMALLLLQQIGVSISSVWTVLSAVIAMIAIGFVAMWSVLSNLLCTIMLLVFHPFRIGDEVEVIDPAMTTGMKGRVRNINLIFTNLREETENSDDFVEIQIPNNLFFQKIIKKKSGGRTFPLDQQLWERRSLLRGENAGSGAT